MPNTHRALVSLTAAVAFATFVMAGPALAQTPGQAAQPAQPGQAKPTQPAEQPKAPATSVQGDLLRVDPEAKTITIQPAQGADQEFKYTDDTKVVGGDKGVAGLATMKGSKVTIQFKAQGSDRVATQIEVHPKSGG